MSLLFSVAVSPDPSYQPVENESKTNGTKTCDHETEIVYKQAPLVGHCYSKELLLKCYIHFQKQKGNQKHIENKNLCLLYPVNTNDTCPLDKEQSHTSTHSWNPSFNLSIVRNGTSSCVSEKENTTTTRACHFTRRADIGCQSNVYNVSHATKDFPLQSLNRSSLPCRSSEQHSAPMLDTNKQQSHLTLDRNTKETTFQTSTHTFPRDQDNFAPIEKFLSNSFPHSHSSWKKLDETTLPKPNVGGVSQNTFPFEVPTVSKDSLNHLFDKTQSNTSFSSQEEHPSTCDMLKKTQIINAYQSFFSSNDPVTPFQLYNTQALASKASMKMDGNKSCEKLPSLPLVKSLETKTLLKNEVCFNKTTEDMLSTLLIHDAQVSEKPDMKKVIYTNPNKNIFQHTDKGHSMLDVFLNSSNKEERNVQSTSSMLSQCGDFSTSWQPSSETSALLPFLTQKCSDHDTPNFVATHEMPCHKNGSSSMVTQLDSITSSIQKNISTHALTSYDSFSKTFQSSVCVGSPFSSSVKLCGTQIKSSYCDESFYPHSTTNTSHFMKNLASTLTDKLQPTETPLLAFQHKHKEFNAKDQSFFFLSESPFNKNQKVSDSTNLEDSLLLTPFQNATLTKKTTSFNSSASLLNDEAKEKKQWLEFNTMWNSTKHTPNVTKETPCDTFPPIHDKRKLENNLHSTVALKDELLPFNTMVSNDSSNFYLNKKDTFPFLPQTLEDKVWEYCDPSGTIQGPFSTTQMYKWYKGGFFPDALLMRYHSMLPWLPFYKLYPLHLHESLSPFASLDFPRVDQTGNVTHSSLLSSTNITPHLYHQDIHQPQTIKTDPPNKPLEPSFYHASESTFDPHLSSLLGFKTYTKKKKQTDLSGTILQPQHQHDHYPLSQDFIQVTKKQNNSVKSLSFSYPTLHQTTPTLPQDQLLYGTPHVPTKSVQPTPSWKPILKDFLPNTQTLSHETLEKSFQKTLEKTFTEALEKENKSVPKEKSSTWKPIHTPSIVTVDTKEFPEPSSLPAKVVEDRPHTIKFKSNSNETDGFQKKTKKTLNEYIKSQERKNMPQKVVWNKVPDDIYSKEVKTFLSTLPSLEDAVQKSFASSKTKAKRGEQCSDLSHHQEKSQPVMNRLKKDQTQKSSCKTPNTEDIIHKPVFQQQSTQSVVSNLQTKNDINDKSLPFIHTLLSKHDIHLQEPIINNLMKLKNTKDVVQYMKQITSLDEPRLMHFAHELLKQHESEKTSSYEKDFPVEEFFMVTNNTLPNMKTHSTKQNGSMLSTWTRVVNSKPASLQDTKKSCDVKPTKKTSHSESVTVEKKIPLVYNKENKKSAKLQK